MLISRLLRSLLRFLSPGIVPDEGGGAPAPAPAADTPDPAPAPAEPTDAPAAAPAAAQDDEPADRLAGLTAALDAISEKPVGTPAPTPAPTAAPAATPAPAQAAKKDEFDYTPPEGMAERAQQRWADLTARAKQVPVLEQRASEAEGQLGAVRQMVTDSGMSAEEFADTMQLAKLARSTNRQEAEQALQRLDAIRADIAGRHGIDAAGVDPLAAHPDLKAEVEAMALTKERALEIARGRDAERRLQASSAETREMAQFRQTVESAAASMDATLRTREGTPGHQEKLNYIGNLFKDPARLQKFVTTYAPEQWEGALLDIYDAYQPPVAPTPTPAVPQPLRPGAVRAGAPVRSGPVTAETAVGGAFDRLGL